MIRVSMIMVRLRVDDSIVLLRSHGIQLGFDPAVGGVLEFSGGPVEPWSQSDCLHTDQEWVHMGVPVSDHASRFETT